MEQQPACPSEFLFVNNEKSKTNSRREFGFESFGTAFWAWLPLWNKHKQIWISTSYVKLRGFGSLGASRALLEWFVLGLLWAK